MFVQIGLSYAIAAVFNTLDSALKPGILGGDVTVSVLIGEK